MSNNIQISQYLKKKNGHKIEKKNQDKKQKNEQLFDDKNEYERYQQLEVLINNMKIHKQKLKQIKQDKQIELQQKNQKIQDTSIKQNNNFQSYQNMISFLLQEYIETEEQIQELEQSDKKQSILHSTNILNNIFQFKEQLNEAESLDNFHSILNQFQDKCEQNIEHQQIKIEQTQQHIQSRIGKVEQELKNLDAKIDKEKAERKIEQKEYITYQKKLDSNLINLNEQQKILFSQIEKTFAKNLDKQIIQIDQIKTFINQFFEFFNL